ncbi:YciI family protein [uncultured Tateyamaria sp.]|uniref:YciI family protein n=1 Tax=Tateyamaria sp. 1078 TaxID=3417464 RepID=UPI00262CB868|nr:YciI family protein [uncultured Tateyamaria sp.]
MTFIILFEDATDADPDIRTTHMADHLRFLETHADRIRAAGPLSDPTGGGRDGLWIVTTATANEAEQLVRQDPFWPTGLRKSYAIIPWKQVFADGTRLIQPG